jgi:glyoxylase-like metal-dependent hydrolase (beta-lactamase superfamily II)
MMRAVHTPGHTSNHLCFAFEQERALFSGDHVMGWSTTVIAPPDGDMRAYFESLHRVAARNDATLWPTHGAPVTAPQPFLAAFLAHRLGREAQVLAAVRGGQTSIAAMVKVLYADVRKELHKPARRSVLSHLVKLVDDGLVAVADGGRPTLRATYLPT